MPHVTHVVNCFSTGSRVACFSLAIHASHLVSCFSASPCQARALLLAASWLQRYLTQKRITDGLAPANTWQPSSFRNGHIMLVLGGAGAGKTFLLLAVESLFQHFVGGGCIQKAAPTITAARLLGGNTLHALHRLPRADLTSKFGKLSAVTLAKHRKAWANAVGHAADEIGMLSPKVLHQIDVRSQCARQVNEPFGGLWSWLSGDFLQLPPVGQPSLAQPVDPLEDDAAKNAGQQKDFEAEDDAANGDAEHRPWA